jgi:DNA-directed RNA polymerase specialized sigma24 family protein
VVQADDGPATAAATLAPDPRPAVPVGFSEFFRSNNRVLFKAALYAGASDPEAREATATTMLDVLERWAQLDNPVAFARKAVLHNFYRRRVPGSEMDSERSMWEDQEWVGRLLGPLTDAQRQVMHLVVDEGLRPGEISRVLGRTPEAVQVNLEQATRRMTAQVGSARRAEQ